MPTSKDFKPTLNPVKADLNPITCVLVRNAVTGEEFWTPRADYAQNPPAETFVVTALPKREPVPVRDGALCYVRKVRR